MRDPRNRGAPRESKREAAAVAEARVEAEARRASGTAPLGIGAAPGAQSDEALVERARRGDRTAFDDLVLRYQDRIYNLCFQKLGDAEEAQDAAQEAFVKAWRGLSGFEGKAQFFTWIFRIAVNCAFTRRRKRGRERGLAPISLDQAGSKDGDGGEERGIEAPDERQEPVKAALGAEQARVLREAIASLDEEQHRIVLLRDVEGLAYEEIAEILDCPIGSVKSRLHRARLVLRERLKGYLGADGPP
jgi:RNA polymerase sigma-70 factor (ECF subfamily)